MSMTLDRPSRDINARCTYNTQAPKPQPWRLTHDPQRKKLTLTDGIRQLTMSLAAARTQFPVYEVGTTNGLFELCPLKKFLRGQ